tara:strand:- start:1058 stop:1828 length:771 start_codon:yes stop_codon:yes gene_type:complete
MNDIYLKDLSFKKSDIHKDKIHAFFTRNGGVSKGNFKSLNCAFSRFESDENVKKNRSIVCSSLTLDSNKLVLLNQIHSSKVLIINKDNYKYLHNGDGMITQEKGIVLGILTADCAPVIILGRRFVGIIHLGWRGLLNNILENTFFLLKKNGESTNDLIFLVGPHLKLNSYEVKKDFLNNLSNYGIDSQKYIKNFTSKMYFDFSNLIKDKIKLLGIKKFLISKINTFENPDAFFSYRLHGILEKKSCGRHMSIVSIK